MKENKGGLIMVCKRCGAQVETDVVFCPKCGTPTADVPVQTQPVIHRPTGLQNTAKAFMVIACIIEAISIIPLLFFPSVLGYIAYYIEYYFGIVLPALMTSSIASFLIAIAPLLWMIPMTVSYGKKITSGEKVGVGFKLCTLLFVNLISGILMLCDKN